MSVSRGRFPVRRLMKFLEPQSIIRLCVGLLAVGNFALAFVPTVIHSRVADDVSRATEDMRVLADALEHYRSDWERYPQRLELLMRPPRYIAAIPMQPFVRTATPWYSYHRAGSGQSYVLVCPGPDNDFESGKMVIYKPSNGLRSDGDIYWGPEGEKRD